MTESLDSPRGILQALSGDIVGHADMAIELAEVLLRRGFGEDCLKAQQPLSARDAGEYWAIDGKADALEAATGTGPVKIELKKADASVASLYFELSKDLKAKLPKPDRPPK
jgi:hypothetical protein